MRRNEGTAIYDKHLRKILLYLNVSKLVDEVVVFLPARVVFFFLFTSKGLL